MPSNIVDGGSSWRRLRGLLRRAREGTAVVEFALGAPVLMALLVPLADLGIAYSQQLQVAQAAQAGAQYATFHPWNSNSVNAQVAYTPPLPYSVLGRSVTLSAQTTVRIR